MRKSDRQRIDYMPCSAAREALEIAQRLHPDSNAQALIDRLVITGLVAMQWKPPSLYGRDREQWRLPASVGDVPASDG